MSKDGLDRPVVVTLNDLLPGGAGGGQVGDLADDGQQLVVLGGVDGCDASDLMGTSWAWEPDSIWAGVRRMPS